MTSIGSDITLQVANGLGNLKLKSAKTNFSLNAQTQPIKREEDYIYNNVQKNQIDFIEKNQFGGRFSNEEINEMKEISLSMGENLTDDDIAYALKYGRSVIADYSV